MLLLTQEKLGFHADGLGDESAGETFVALEAFEEFLAGLVARVKFREMVLDRGITEPTEDPATPVVLFNRDDTEIGLAEVIDVTIDMIRYHTVGDAAEPGICHQLMETISVSMPVNIRVTLSLTATATGVETFAVGVLLPEVDTTITQPKFGEGIHATSLREEETDTVIRLTKACAVTQDQLPRVGHIESEPYRSTRFSFTLVALFALCDTERFACTFHLNESLC